MTVTYSPRYTEREVVNLHVIGYFRPDTVWNRHALLFARLGIILKKQKASTNALGTSLNYFEQGRICQL